MIQVIKTIALHRLLSTVVLLFSCTLANGQFNIHTPDSIAKEYISENYSAASQLANGYLQYVISNYPDSLKQEYVIRLAYLWAWNGRTSLNYATAYDKGWKDGLIKFGLKASNIELADHLAVLAVKANFDERYRDAADTLLLSISYRSPSNPVEKAILADCHQFLGRLYAEQQDYSKAISNFNEAKSINLNNKRAFANYQIDLEMVPSRIIISPDDPKILNTLEDCLTFFIRRGKEELIPLTHNEMGNYFFSTDNYAKAADHFRVFLQMRRTQDDLENIHVAYNNLGVAFSRLSMADSARYYLEKALEFTPPDNYLQAAIYHSNIGAQFGSLNQPDSALTQLNEAVNLLLPLQTNNKLEQLTKLPISHPILPILLANQGNALLELFHHSGNEKQLIESVQVLEQAVEMFDQLRYLSSYESKNLAVHQNRSFYYLALEAAIELYQHTALPEDLQKAFQFSYKTKSAVFDEYQRVLLARDSMGIDVSLIKKDDSLKRLKAQTSQEMIDFLRLGSEVADSVSHRNSTLIKLDQEIDKLSITIGKLYPAYHQYIHAPDKIDLLNIQSLLNSNEVILDFTYSTDQIITLLITQDTVYINNALLPDNFRNLINKYRSFFTRHSQLGFSDFIEVGYKLYDILIAPLSDYCLHKKLIIIPDGPLGYIPFDALCTKPEIPIRKNYNALPMIIKTTTVSYLNSIQQFRSAKKFQYKQSVRIQAFAPFVDEPYYLNQRKLNQLIGSGEELSSIRRKFSSSLYENKRASLGKFYQVSKKGDVLHLATHGILSSGNPMNNLLIFTPEQHKRNQLHLFEIINLPIKSPLVILSACDTGVGDLFEGEGIMSLTRGFHFAGVPAVIMSLWPAYDKPAVAIMDNFYRELDNGQSTAEALQKAKLNYLSAALSSESHPGFWANYQLSGINDNIPLRKNHNYIYLLGVIIGICTLSIIVLKTSRNKKRKQ